MVGAWFLLPLCNYATKLRIRKWRWIERAVSHLLQRWRKVPTLECPSLAAGIQNKPSPSNHHSLYVSRIPIQILDYVHSYFPHSAHITRNDVFQSATCTRQGHKSRHNRQSRAVQQTKPESPAFPRLHREQNPGIPNYGRRSVE